MILKFAPCFDDVLLVPQYNTIPSRKDPSIDLSVTVSPYLKLKLPIMSSPMDTITENDMAVRLWIEGGLGVVHRYNSIERQVNEAVVVRSRDARAAFAIGATGDYMERATALSKVGVDIFCVDVAHGDSAVVIEAVKKLRVAFPKSTIIAGNVATGSGAKRLRDAGADAVRVGIGSGSNCSTRVISGSGTPTLASLIDCREWPSLNDTCLIADGGIKNSGDCVKALAGGANVVMLGNMLAGTDEAPGPVIESNGKKYKRYRGMASRSAVVEWRPETKETVVPEGEESLAPYKGAVSRAVYNIVGGVRSGMTYSGARTVKELQRKAKFVQVSHAGSIESQAHAKFQT